MGNWVGADRNIKEEENISNEQRVMLRQRLLQYHFFRKALSAGELELAIFSMRRKTLESGESWPESPKPYLWIVEDGIVDVKNSSSTEIIRLTPGNIYGEVLLISPLEPGSIVQAVLPSTLWYLDCNDRRFSLSQPLVQQWHKYELFLAYLEWLKIMNYEERSRIVYALSEKSWKAGDVILKEGDNDNAYFYIVCQGEVKCTCTCTVSRNDFSDDFLDENYNEKSNSSNNSGSSGNGVSSKISVGGYFGELGILYHQPRSATVCATSDVTCLLLHKNDFLELVAKNKYVRTMMELHMKTYAGISIERVGLSAEKLPGTPYLVKRQ